MRLLNYTAIAAAAVVLACNDSLAPFHPEIANLTGSFQFQATNVRDLSSTLDYTWQNNGTIANVNQATVLAVGAATLTILDANNTQVYTKDLTANGTFQTSAGVAGAWKIHVVLNHATGTLNFRVQTP